LRLIESTNMLMFVEEKKNEKFLTVPRWEYKVQKQHHLY
jgi:hypothetical protein